MARATSSRGQEVGRPPVVLLVLVPAVGLVLVVGRLALEELRDVVEHEPLALAVLERAAVAAHALGDQDAAHRRRPDHARRVELDELHVDQVGARPERQGVAVARVLPGVRRDLPRLADAAGGEHDGLRLEDDERARSRASSRRRRDTRSPSLSRRGDRALHEHVDAAGGCRGAAGSGSSPGRCGRPRGPAARSGGRRSRAARMRPSLVRSNSAPHPSSSSTRSGASWAWSWAMRQLLSILPPRMVSRKWTCQLSSGHTLPRAAAMPPSAMTVCALPSSDLQTRPTEHALGGGLDGRAQPGAARADDEDVVLVCLVRLQLAPSEDDPRVADDPHRRPAGCRGRSAPR